MLPRFTIARPCARICICCPATHAALRCLARTTAVLSRASLLAQQAGAHGGLKGSFLCPRASLLAQQAGAHGGLNGLLDVAAVLAELGGRLHEGLQHTRTGPMLSMHYSMGTIGAVHVRSRSYSYALSPMAPNV